MGGISFFDYHKKILHDLWDEYNKQGIKFIGRPLYKKQFAYFMALDLYDLNRRIHEIKI